MRRREIPNARPNLNVTIDGSTSVITVSRVSDNRDIEQTIYLASQNNMAAENRWLEVLRWLKFDRSFCVIWLGGPPRLMCVPGTSHQDHRLWAIPLVTAIQLSAQHSTSRFCYSDKMRCPRRLNFGKI